MDQEKEKSIRFPKAVHEKLQKIALKLGRTQLQVFGQMVEYFHRSGKDPQDFNEGILLKQLGKNHDKYIAFVKMQENMFLMPMKEDMEQVIVKQDKIVTGIRDHVIRGTQQLVIRQAEVDKLMRIICDKLDTADRLKAKFMEVLDYYIVAREKFSLMTSGKEKDELIEKTRQRIFRL